MQKDKDKMMIDGYEFPKEYPSGTDLENLNSFLKGKFLEFYVQDFLSRRHLNLYPKKLGLRAKPDFSMEVVLWDHSTYDQGEYAPGWDCSTVNDPEQYVSDILEYYKKNDPAFYSFIKGRM